MITVLHYSYLFEKPSEQGMGGVSKKSGFYYRRFNSEVPSETAQTAPNHQIRHIAMIAQQGRIKWQQQT